MPRPVISNCLDQPSYHPVAHVEGEPLFWTMPTRWLNQGQVRFVTEHVRMSSVSYQPILPDLLEKLAIYFCYLFVQTMTCLRVRA